MSTSELCDRLAIALAIHAHATGLQTSANLNNRAVLSETLFRSLLNALYGWNLQSSNIENANAAAIDLTDKDRRIAVQVTAQKDDLSGKITDSLKKFGEKNLHLEYDSFYLLSIREEPSLKTKQMVFPAKIVFNPSNHIISPGSIIKKACTMDEKELAPIVENFIRDLGLQEEEDDLVFRAHLFVLALKKGVNPGIDGKFEPDCAYEEGGRMLRQFESSSRFVQLRGHAALSAKDFVRQAYLCLDRIRVFASTSQEERTKNFNLALEAWRKLEKARVDLSNSLEPGCS